MRPVLFQPTALPDGVAGALRRRLERSHRQRPFSTRDPRDTVRRVAALAEGLGLSTTVYRGGVDVRGAEVDHVWLGIDGRVIDAALPLYAKSFVEVLRRYVAGDEDAEELEAAALSAGISKRVVGLYPPLVRYLGAPVWASRDRGR